MVWLLSDSNEMTMMMVLIAMVMIFDDVVGVIMAWLDGSISLKRLTQDKIFYHYHSLGTFDLR
jgi:hypothetical protein